MTEKEAKNIQLGFAVLVFFVVFIMAAGSCSGM